MIKKFQIVFALTLITLYACSDVIVPDDIKDETVELIAPANDLLTSIQAHTFWWEELDFVDRYNLQIVSPNFENPERLVLDTNVVGDNFTVTLSDNTYQWRVKGVNEAYESMFDVYNLTISNDTTANLTEQIVNLQTPVNGLCSNEQTFMFLWDDLNGADQYILQIGNQDFTDLRLNLELTDNFYEYEIIEEGEYFWRVRAESSTSQTFTDWATAGFSIDLTAPNAPGLNSPVDGATLDYMNLDPDLEWTPASDALEDSLFIYSDNLGDTLLFKIALETTSYNLQDGDIDFSNIFFEEDYFWQLNSTDKSGNTSERSELRVFYIQQ